MDNEEFKKWHDEKKSNHSAPHKNSTKKLS